jgi:hypothetical protein
LGLGHLDVHFQDERPKECLARRVYSHLSFLTNWVLTFPLLEGV